ncbi:chorismate lyase [Moritella sp. Urea-trap-13]|uniref:chorismate--pyruvate lyase family protein n=1 Tax=Moritella sp. Urea-trap-13 TaxID=2058327 RepID=UPI000C3266E2|nr:chorismate lyase [Moritella sp. Urea-trap-13]PKH07664.1 chorismate lyase [Moritella sp. Urea-trap-13]
MPDNIDNTRVRELTLPNYPIGCDAKWLWPSILEDSLSVNLYDWLVDTGSLTARLKQYCQKFSVEILSEGNYALSDDEKTKLNLAEDLGFVREVLLKLDGTPWVFARSVMPLNMLTAPGGELDQLGNRSLGSVLFSAPDMQRSEIEIAAFDAQSKVYSLSQLFSSTPKTVLFGRRSCFLLNGKSLLVSEVFLPDASAYKE